MKTATQEANATVASRLFVGVFPTGISYADRAAERHGDYARVAFLPFATLTFEVLDQASPLVDEARKHAAGIQARRGQPFEVSESGQTVVLGGKALAPYRGLTVADITHAHYVDDEECDDHAEEQEGIFRCVPADASIDAYPASARAVETAHPGASISLFREEAECDRRGCDVVAIRYGVVAEFDGQRHEYALLEGGAS